MPVYGAGNYIVTLSLTQGTERESEEWKEDESSANKRRLKIMKIKTKKEIHDICSCTHVDTPTHISP